MPRTVEGIVESFQLAEERRHQRKPVWDGKLSFLKQLGPLAERMDAGDTTVTAQMLLEAFHAAAKEVREKVPQAKGAFFPMADEDLEYFVVSLEEWTVEFIEACPDILEEFNNALDRLYDWCDRNRWWIEQP